MNALKKFEPVGDKDYGCGSVFDVSLSLGVPINTRIETVELSEAVECFVHADFAREAIHPDHGPRALDWFLQLYAWHGRHHIGHIRLTH